MHPEEDAGRPHPGRMYDYIIGGTYNYEADRLAADQFVKLVPSIPVAARLNRTFLAVAASRWQSARIDHIVDLGAGLPTRGHLNEQLPEARILFVDRDPLTVAYGQDLLSDAPRCEYVELDVLDGASLVKAMVRVLGADQRLGVGFVGLSYFLSEDEVHNLLETITRCCAPGSVLAMSYLSASTAAAAERLLAEYARVVHAPLFLRAPDEMAPLVGPWRVVENRPVEEFTVSLPPDPTTGSPDDEIRMHGLIATTP